ncbi:hypothetical protein HaLaN_31613 [Haematococcus lacustris]|uniref:Secreted protein n=1 Tax=Haematococcus lacustris TaxID=44745 RepID=A0A6A0AJE8_HAELA|nr:hypothetical protein HaLaN_31613 [Haematococcus lacustris]
MLQIHALAVWWLRASHHCPTAGQPFTLPLGLHYLDNGRCTGQGGHVRAACGRGSLKCGTSISEHPMTTRADISSCWMAAPAANGRYPTPQ